MSYTNKNVLSEELKKELDNRYEHFLNHHKEYVNWETVKKLKTNAHKRNYKATNSKK